ncbi:MAG TPA: triacylglycerol lipase [Longimicrobium sp.]|jgi:triacylglycerol lipase
MYHRLKRLPIVVAAVTLTACGGDLLGPAGARRAVIPPAHDPIIFVHGWHGTAGTWTTMIGRFKADGWTDAELSNFTYNSDLSNATTAKLLAARIDSVLAATGATRVDIVTHSMGGLSSRYYTKNLGGGGKVDAWVSLGGPNHGTQTAYACFTTACKEMYPGSTFLKSLNATDETPGTPRYATFWSPCDEVINPDSSVPLSGASNNQTACLSHSNLHQDATVYGKVRDWVK